MPVLWNAPFRGVGQKTPERDWGVVVPFGERDVLLGLQRLHNHFKESVLYLSFANGIIVEMKAEGETVCPSRFGLNTAVPP